MAEINDGVNRGRKKEENHERYNLYLAHHAFWLILVAYLIVSARRRKTGHSRALVAEFWPSVRHYRRVLASYLPIFLTSGQLVRSRFNGACS